MSLEGRKDVLLTAFFVATCTATRRARETGEHGGGAGIAVALAVAGALNCHLTAVSWLENSRFRTDHRADCRQTQAEIPDKHSLKTQV